MGFVKTLVLLTFVVSCAHTPANRSDLEAVVQAALPSVAGNEPVELLAGADLTSDARKAIERTRSVRTPKTTDESVYLAANQLRIDEVTVTGDRARFRATLGPVPRPKSGIVVLACGTKFDIALEKRDGVWVVGRHTLTVC